MAVAHHIVAGLQREWGVHPAQSTVSVCSSQDVTVKWSRHRKAIETLHSRSKKADSRYRAHQNESIALVHAYILVPIFLLLARAASRKAALLGQKKAKETLPVVQDHAKKKQI